MKRRGLIAAAACVGLAAASLLIPSAPTTDPWGWIVWGREIAHLQLQTAIGGAPSWKPLPVLFTTPFSVFGGAARALLAEAERQARGLGFRSVALDTAMSNEPARALYASAGFDEVDYRAPGRGLPGFVALVKPLS